MSEDQAAAAGGSCAGPACPGSPVSWAELLRFVEGFRRDSPADRGHSTLASLAASSGGLWLASFAGLSGPAGALLACGAAGVMALVLDACERRPLKEAVMLLRDEPDTHAARVLGAFLREAARSERQCPPGADFTASLIFEDACHDAQEALAQDAQHRVLLWEVSHAITRERARLTAPSRAFAQGWLQACAQLSLERRQDPPASREGANGQRLGELLGILRSRPRPDETEPPQEEHMKLTHVDSPQSGAPGIPVVARGAALR